MAIKQYSKKKDGNKNLTPHFKVKEFASPDSDKILIDERLPRNLEKLRKHFEKKGKSISVTITSGYRTPAENRRVGGATNSRHLTGRAVDIVIKVGGKNIASKYVMCAAQDIGFKGIAKITDSAVHLDFKPGMKYYYDETRRNRNGYYVNFPCCYKYFGIKKPKK